MTKFQEKVAATVRRLRVDHRNSLTEIARAMRTGRAPVHSALMAMRRRGEADYTRGTNPDRWSGQMWFVKPTPSSDGGDK